jgi:uncharacterized membrane protein YesL
LAGFFGFFDYSKPGKGVDVDAPPKKPFFRFWELYWRKFTRFILLNMLFFLFMLPIVTLLFQTFNTWFFSILPESVLEELFKSVESEEGGTLVFGMLQSILMAVPYSVPPQVSLLLLAASAVLYGPAMCGMSYILRNYVREEHAWMSDFFAQMKKNFRQGLALGLLELLVLSLLFFNVSAQPAEGTAQWLTASLPVIKYISIFLIILVLFARQYMYVMAVTFDLRLTGVIKNAFAFSIVGLFRNLGLILAEAVLIVVVLLVPYADIILVPFFFFSFTGFLTMFACFPLIHKHMILPSQERKELGEADSDGEGST